MAKPTTLGHKGEIFVFHIFFALSPVWGGGGEGDSLMLREVPLTYSWLAIVPAGASETRVSYTAACNTLHCCRIDINKR